MSPEISCEDAVYLHRSCCGGTASLSSEEGNQGYSNSSFLHRIRRNYMELPVGGLKESRLM